MFSKIMCSSADVFLVTSPLANCTSNGVVGIPAFFFAVIEVATVVRRRQRHAIDSCSRASGASKKNAHLCDSRLVPCPRVRRASLQYVTWRQAQNDPPEESCDTVAEKPETRCHRFLLCLHARTLKLSGEKSFNDVPLPRPSAKMVQRPDGPVQDGQQRVRQNFCPVEQLHPLPLIDTFRAWWFWRRHEVVSHVLSQLFANFQGVFGEQIV